MSEREKLEVRIKTLKEALDIASREGGEINGDGYDYEDGSAHIIATKLDQRIRDAEFDLRRMK